MGRHCDYNNLPTTNSVAMPSEAEITLIRRSSRWVVFLSFVQFITMVFTVFLGGLIFALVGTLFVSFGIVGAMRKNYRYLMAHFVFSIIMYIGSVVGFVLYLFYCPHFNWLISCGFMLHILIQAVGVRSSRILMFSIKKFNLEGVTNCQLRSHFENMAVAQIAQQEVVVLPTEDKSTETQVENSEVSQASIPMMAAPFQSPYSVPPYMMYPVNMQNMKYPMVQQPISVVPQAIPYFTPFAMPPQKEGEN